MGNTNYDLHTTVAGVISGICIILASMGFHIPSVLTSQTFVGILAGVAVGVLGYYTNKQKAIPAAPPAPDVKEPALMTEGPDAAGSTK